jgi:acetyltransferase-like isoleucine patch superfamily enzyme
MTKHETTNETTTASQVKEYKTKGTTRLQGALTDDSTSAISKYQDINVDKSGLISLLAFELYTVFFMPLPGAIGYLLRKFYLKRLLGSCGGGLIVGRGVTIRHPAKIHLGENVAVDDYAVLDAKGDSNRGITLGNNVLVGRNTVLSCKDGDIEIGDNSNIAQSCFIQSASKVSVGEKVLFGAYCYLIGGGDHKSDSIEIPIMDQGQTMKGINVSNNSWLGASVQVLDGTNIGRDSIVGSGSVVTRDVDDYTVVAGIPAKKIKDRRES